MGIAKAHFLLNTPNLRLMASTVQMNGANIVNDASSRYFTQFSYYPYY
ncbi:MAG: hypothetical protein ACJAXS_003342 [Colwellia sp.]|jgi:hypothetical protein